MPTRSSTQAAVTPSTPGYPRPCCPRPGQRREQRRRVMHEVEQVIKPAARIGRRPAVKLGPHPPQPQRRPPWSPLRLPPWSPPQRPVTAGQSLRLRHPISLRRPKPRSRSRCAKSCRRRSAGTWVAAGQGRRAVPVQAPVHFRGRCRVKATGEPGAAGRLTSGPGMPSALSASGQAVSTGRAALPSAAR